MSFAADIAIGLSLVLIGAISLYEAKSIDFSAQVPPPPFFLPQFAAECGRQVVCGTGGRAYQTLSGEANPQTPQTTLQMVEARSQEKQTMAMKANVLINGVFHGLALDGIPTLMPVLGLASLNSALAFLAAYGFGVIAAMVGATVIIGQSTTSLAKRKKEFDLSKIIKGSAFAAIIIGVLWTARAVIAA